MAFFGGGASVDLASPSAIGSTTPNTGAFTTLSANNGTITTSSPAFTLAQTWNAAGVAFTAIQANITDTSSASGSYLLDLQVGGSTKFRIGKGNTHYLGGNFVIGGGTALECYFSEATALARTVSNRVVFFGQESSVGMAMSSGYGISWSSNAAGSGDCFSNRDLFLLRDAAGTLAQRNSTNAQTFRIYNTFTDASNYERGFMRWNTNVLEIGAEAAGTGTQRTLSFLGGSNNSAISFTANSLCAIFGNNSNIFYKIIQLEAGLRYTGNDAGLFRNAAGVVEVNNGTAGTFRDLIVRNFRMSAPTLVPASASATGSEGQISWDASYIYVCTATNTWKRVAIATW